MKKYAESIRDVAEDLITAIEESEWMDVLDLMIDIHSDLDSLDKAIKDSNIDI